MIAAVLFDLDGTLVDSGQDLADSVSELLAELGLPPLHPAQIRSFVGDGARTLVRRSLDAADPQGRIARDDPRLARFLDLYRARLLHTTVPYPGIPALLRALATARVPAAVVTNKPEALARQVVGGLALGPLDALVGGDTLPERKPSPAPLRRAADLLGVRVERCVMVGDSAVDIEAADAAGCPSIWCAWGLHPDQPARASRRVDSVEALAQALRRP